MSVEPGSVALPRVLLVTQDGLPAAGVVAAWPALVAAVPHGGVALSVRYRGLEARHLVELVTALQQAAAAAPLLVSGRVDVAAACGVGVHLAGSGLPSAHARALLGPGAIVIAAVHDVAQAQAARDASLALVSPVWAPASHASQHAPLGPAAAAALAQHSGRPWLALGGVTSENAAGVMAAGAHGVAVTSAVFGAPDPVAALRQLWERVGALSQRPAVG